MSTVLENHFDPNYEPTQSEIVEYGKWLGMTLPEDEELLWLAREGLCAPLPDHWKACKSEKGELYYFNFSTGKSIWDHPMDEHFKQRLVEEKAKLADNKKNKKENLESDKENTANVKTNKTKGFNTGLGSTTANHNDSGGVLTKSSSTKERRDSSKRLVSIIDPAVQDNSTKGGTTILKNTGEPTAAGNKAPVINAVISTGDLIIRAPVPTVLGPSKKENNASSFSSSNGTAVATKKTALGATSTGIGGGGGNGNVRSGNSLPSTYDHQKRVDTSTSAEATFISAAGGGGGGGLIDESNLTISPNSSPDTTVSNTPAVNSVSASASSTPKNRDNKSKNDKENEKEKGSVSAKGRANVGIGNSKSVPVKVLPLTEMSLIVTGADTTTTATATPRGGGTKLAALKNLKNFGNSGSGPLPLPSPSPSFSSSSVAFSASASGELLSVSNNNTPRSLPDTPSSSNKKPEAPKVLALNKNHNNHLSTVSSGLPLDTTPTAQIRSQQQLAAGEEKAAPHLLRTSSDPHSIPSLTLMTAPPSPSPSPGVTITAADVGTLLPIISSVAATTKGATKEELLFTIDAKKAEEAARVQSVLSEYKAQMALKAEEERASIRKEHEEKVNALRQSLEASFKAQKEEMEESHKRRVALARQEHDSELKVVSLAHREDMLRAREEAKRERDTLEQELKSLKDELVNKIEHDRQRLASSPPLTATITGAGGDNDAPPQWAKADWALALEELSREADTLLSQREAILMRGLSEGFITARATLISSHTTEMEALTMAHKAKLTLEVEAARIQSEKEIASLKNSLSALEEEVTAKARRRDALSAEIQQLSEELDSLKKSSLLENRKPFDSIETSARRQHSKKKISSSRRSSSTSSSSSSSSTSSTASPYGSGDDGSSAGSSASASTVGLNSLAAADVNAAVLAQLTGTDFGGSSSPRPKTGGITTSVGRGLMKGGITFPVAPLDVDAIAAASPPLSSIAKKHPNRLPPPPLSPSASTLAPSSASPSSVSSSTATSPPKSSTATLTDSPHHHDHHALLLVQPSVTAEEVRTIVADVLRSLFVQQQQEEEHNEKEDEEEPPTTTVAVPKVSRKVPKANEKRDKNVEEEEEMRAAEFRKRRAPLFTSSSSSPQSPTTTATNDGMSHAKHTTTTKGSSHDADVVVTSSPTSPLCGSTNGGVGLLNVTLPTSFREQHEMLQSERKRLSAAKSFMGMQAAEIEERKTQFKAARHQWKRDVLKAKAEGHKSDSQKGQLLRNVHKVLERQASGLAHDEMVLAESLSWLGAKEKRVGQLEAQLTEAERAVLMEEEASQKKGSARNDISTASIETAALISDFFQNESLLAGGGRRGGSGSRRWAASDPHSKRAVTASAASDEENEQVHQQYRRSSKSNSTSGNAAAKPSDPSHQRNQRRHADPSSATIIGDEDALLLSAAHHSTATTPKGTTSAPSSVTFADALGRIEKRLEKFAKLLLLKQDEQSLSHISTGMGSTEVEHQVIGGTSAAKAMASLLEAEAGLGQGRDREKRSGGRHSSSVDGGVQVRGASSQPVSNSKAKESSEKKRHRSSSASKKRRVEFAFPASLV